MAKLKHECLIYITTSRELPCEDSDVTFVHLPKWGTQDDRNLLLIVGLDNGSVLEYDIHESCIDECIPTMTHRGHNDTISAIDTINEGKRILTISHDGTFIEWKKESLKSYVFNKNDIQKPPLLSLLLMLDEFYTGDVQGSIKAYHSSNKQFLRRHRVNSSPVTHIKHYNNSCFISGHMDGRICLWQRKEEVPPRRVLRGLNTALSGLAVHPEGFAYASTGGCTSDVLVRSLPLDSLSNDVIKTLNSTSRLPIDRVSLSWDLTSGWQDQLFPSDISCMFLYTDDTDSGDNISKKPDDTIKEYRLITGHFDGKVKVWLTEGRSSEAIAASRKCIYLNDKLYAAERELEDLRIIEEREFEVLTSIKHSRKPYFGLTLLLTSATEITRLLPGINCLKNSTRVRPAEDDLTPDLNKVFQNSLDSRPELLWTGLQALRRHVAAEEAGPAVRAKDAVDAKREEIAQVRELAVAADRNITDILAKGQLLQSMSALSSSITVISASAGKVYAACKDEIGGFDINCSMQRESLIGLEGTTDSLIVSGKHVIAISRTGVLVWKPKLLPQSNNSRVKQTVYECRYVIPKVGSGAVQSVSLSSSDIHISDGDLRSTFLSLSHNGTHIRLSSFIKYWNSLEHFGLSDSCGIKKLLKPQLKSEMSCRKNLVNFHEFGQLMLQYSSR